jgi:hypothetical protein
MKKIILFILMIPIAIIVLLTLYFFVSRLSIFQPKEPWDIRTIKSSNGALTHFKIDRKYNISPKHSDSQIFDLYVQYPDRAFPNNGLPGTQNPNIIHIIIYPSYTDKTRGDRFKLSLDNNRIENEFYMTLIKNDNGFYHLKRNINIKENKPYTEYIFYDEITQHWVFSESRFGSRLGFYRSAENLSKNGNYLVSYHCYQEDINSDLKMLNHWVMQFVESLETTQSTIK